MKYFMAFFLLGLLFLQCTSDYQDMGKAKSYFPEPSQLNYGLVWKYYLHIKEADNDHYKTDIFYKKAQLDQSILTEEFYNAGFQLSGRRKIELSDDAWVVKEHDFVSRDVIYPYSLTDSIYMDWSSNGATYTKRHDNEGEFVIYKDVQESLTDTLIEDESALLVQLSRSTTTFYQGDTIFQNSTIERLYQPGLGETYIKWDRSFRTLEWELDEIISVEEFNKRADHGMHRVAYIDSTAVIDISSGFTTCNKVSEIYDYYNGGDDRARFIGGKGALRKLLSQQLDQQILGDESGYLTFRFVINCNGKAGRFVTEETDLKFNIKEFPDSIKDHFYNIIVGVENWEPLALRGEYYDSYMYLTFKLKDGEIIELLP